MVFSYELGHTFGYSLAVRTRVELRWPTPELVALEGGNSLLVHGSFLRFSALTYLNPALISDSLGSIRSGNLLHLAYGCFVAS